MWIFNLARFLGVIFSVFLCKPSQAQVRRLSQVSTREIQAAAYTQQWKKILFYAPTWGRGEVSLVDDERFFLHEDGKTNPEQELEQTLMAFSEGTPADRQEALCKYPARRIYLQRTLKIVFSDPEFNSQSDVCKRYRTFAAKVKSDSVSLIFSSFFPNNPASLLGHTLLKFRRKAEEDFSGNVLLDYGLNHAAIPTTDNPLLYPFMGMSGMFAGMLSMSPYYVKVQEYNNAESRDLWEYELNLNGDEIELMLASVFELSTHRIDYYYFDDNCSYLMLALIDVGRPSLNLTRKFRAWVAPSDSVRVVANSPSLVKSVQYRPSNVSKYLHLEKSLNENEKNSLRSLLFPIAKSHENAQGNPSLKIDLKALEKLDENEQTRVLDTALEYIGASEKLSAGKKPLRWAAEQEILLKTRAELGTTSASIEVPTPDDNAPHLAYPPTRLNLGLLNVSKPDRLLKPAFVVGWRPALQTLESPIAGMGADLGIGLFNVEFLISGRNISLREFTPVSVESIQLAKPNLSSLSWAFELGHKQRCFEGCRQTYVSVEAGFAFATDDPNARLVARGGLRIGDDQGGALFIEPAAHGIANLPLDATSRWVSRLSFSRLISLWQTPRWIVEAASSYVVRPLAPWEIHGTVQLHNLEMQLLARTFYYF
ncbi:MAG: hypothetical protein RLZZ488_1320 [Pseudomonadota bacterium]|jgi:hypothetical protein